MGDLNSQFRPLELHLAIMADGIARGVPFSNNDHSALTARFRAEGSTFLYVTLPLLGKAVDRGLVTGCFKAPDGHRLRKNTRLPNLFISVFQQIWRDDGDILEQPNVDSIFFLRQILLVHSKLLKEPSLVEKEESVSQFASRQLSLKETRLDTDSEVLRMARAIIGWGFRSLSLSSILPGHGPGIVHEGKDRDYKSDFTYWPLQANKVYPVYEYGVLSLEHLRSKSNQFVFLSRMTTKICLVPKDFRGPRLISAEMSAMQYLQQGQMKKVMDYIDDHRWLRLSMRLRDQTQNQLRSMTSYDDDTATVDLKDASDLVSAPLVWFLFGKTPKLRNHLFRTRSSFADYGDRRIRLYSFAPMGSAVCFPIESIVFWSICMASLHLTTFGNVLRYRSLSELCSLVSVFGDDLIVPKSCLTILFATLNAVGCRINNDKSCYATPFRESCGCEWYKTYSVSITRNRKYTYEHDKLSHYPAVADLQRKFYVAGLRQTAELLATWYGKTVPGNVIAVRQFELDRPFGWSMLLLSVQRGLRSLAPFPFSVKELQEIRDSDASCLFSDRDICLRRRIRWNQRFQRFEFRAPVLIQRTRRWASEGYSRLLSRLISDSTERVSIRDITVKMVWRPCPAGSTTLRGFSRRS